MNRRQRRSKEKREVPRNFRPIGQASKAIFAEFMKTYRGPLDPSSIAIVFNTWVGKATYTEGRLKGFKRFPFNAHTNKHQVRKWIASTYTD